MATENSKCPHCTQQSIVAIGSSIHCVNPDCGAYTVTLSPAQFMALTADDLEGYKRAHSSYEALEVPHKDRTAEIERVIAAAAARQAERTGNEKVYG